MAMYGVNVWPVTIVGGGLVCLTVLIQLTTPVHFAAGQGNQNDPNGLPSLESQTGDPCKAWQDLKASEAEKDAADAAVAKIRSAGSTTPDPYWAQQLAAAERARDKAKADSEAENKKYEPFDALDRQITAKKIEVANLNRAERQLLDAGFGKTEPYVTNILRLRTLIETQMPGITSAEVEETDPVRTKLNDPGYVNFSTAGITLQKKQIDAGNAKIRDLLEEAGRTSGAKSRQATDQMEVIEKEVKALEIRLRAAVQECRNNVRGLLQQLSAAKLKLSEIDPENKATEAIAMLDEIRIKTAILKREIENLNRQLAGSEAAKASRDRANDAYYKAKLAVEELQTKEPPPNTGDLMRARERQAVADERLRRAKEAYGNAARVKDAALNEANGVLSGVDRSLADQKKGLIEELKKKYNDMFKSEHRLYAEDQWEREQKQIVMERLVKERRQEFKSRYFAIMGQEASRLEAARQKLQPFKCFPDAKDLIDAMSRRILALRGAGAGVGFDPRDEIEYPNIPLEDGPGNEIDLTGKWRDDWGYDIVLRHSGGSITGTFTKGSNTGQITGGSYDAKTGKITITYTEPWKQSLGKCEMQLVPGGNTIRGGCTAKMPAYSSPQVYPWSMFRQSGKLTAEFDKVTYRWASRGAGDCGANDIGQSIGSEMPQPERCSAASAGTIAVCWGGQGAWCTYKSRAANPCTGGRNPGIVYECQTSISKLK